MSFYRTPLVLLCLFLVTCVKSQVLNANLDDPGKGIQVSAQYLPAITTKSASLSKQLQSRSQKAVDRLMKQERKLRKHLAKTDTTSASRIFADSEQRYEQLRNSLSKNNTGHLKQYLPSLDTLSTSLRFLQAHQTLLSIS